MIYRTIINGIDVEAVFPDEDIRKKYIPFLKMLTERQQEKGERLLVMLAAPPGAGKTTLLSFLRKLSEETPGITPITTIGMDGFHRYQDYLCSHTTVRNGKEILMVDVKGAPETFDLDKLRTAVQKIASGKELGWPSYNRMTHNPQEEAITINGDIVLLEGNYLLLEMNGWSELKEYADITVKLTADKELLRKRLIQRHQESGKTYEHAVAFVDSSDMVNAVLCLEHSAEADVQWTVK